MKFVLLVVLLLPALLFAVNETPPLYPTLGQEDAVPHPLSPYDTSRGGRTDPVTAAMDEAAHWLQLIDQQQYGPSWLDSGSLLKDIIAQNQWIGAMQVTRRPFGNVLSRNRIQNNNVTQLPNGTKGNFMVIHYRTHFSRNIQAEEVVIMMTNQLGQWRVIAYLIK